MAVFSNYLSEPDAIEFELRDEYVDDLKRMEQNTLGNYCWSYSLYESGEKIDTNVRVAYRDRKYFDTIEESPFTKSNKYFYELFGLNSSNTIPTNESYKETKIYQLLRKIKHKIMK